MGFIDTLAKNLGFNQEEDPLKKKVAVAPTSPTVPKRIYPTPIGESPAPTSFVGALAKSLSADKIPVPTITPFTQTLQKNLKPTIPEMSKSLVEGTGNLTREIFTRPIAKVIKSGLDLSDYLTNQDTFKKDLDPSKDPVTRFIFGDEPIKSYIKSGKEEFQKANEVKKDVKDTSGNTYFKGVGGPLAYSMAFLGTVGIPAGDLLPGGGEKKIIAEKVFKGAIDDIIEAGVKVSKDEDAFKLFKEAGISDDVAKESAPLLAVTKDKKAVEKVIRDTAAKEIQTTAKVITNRIEDLTNKQKGIEIAEDGTKIDVQPQYLTGDEMDELKFLTKNKSKPENVILANRLSDLKDAEKIPNRGIDINQNLYHGTNEIFDTFDLGKSRSGTFDGIHLTDTPEAAKAYGENIKSSEIKGKFYDMGSSSEEAKLLKSHGGTNADTKIFEQKIRDEGYDGIKRGTEYVSFGDEIPNKGLKNITQVAEAKALDTARGAEPVINRSLSGEITHISEPSGEKIYESTSSSAKGTVNTEPKFGDSAPANPKSIKEYGKLRTKLSNAWTGIVEKFQNNANRIEKLVNNPEAKVTEASNPALARVLYSGRLQSRIENVTKNVTTIVQDAVKTAKSVGVKYEDLKNEVNDYLHALHAPERNAHLGDGAAGITDEQALKMMDDVKASPHFAEIKKVADQLLDLNKQTLDILYADGRKEGLISKELYDTLRDRYKNHIPLNRIFDETENIDTILGSHGFDVRGSGLKKAKGSARAVDDIMGNITSNVMSATEHAEKNLVDNATYDFVKNNPELDFARILKDPAEIAKVSKQDSTIMQLRREGKDAFIKFDDPLIAGQFKNIVDQKMPPLLNFIGAFTRFYAGLSTRFNPEFFISNKFRDIQEAMVYAGSEAKLGGKGALKTAGKELKLQNEKSIIDFMNGKDTPGARLYKEMMEEGGTTGGLALSTKKNVVEDIAKIEKLAQSKPRQAVEKIVQSVDKLNEIFENSTRLSVYRTAKEMGLSNKEAAAMAKESTVNFNRKGTASPIINSLYMFSNASIQGSAKMIKAMKNPKVLATVAASVGTAVYTVNKYNNSIDPDWKEKVNKFDRASNMVIVLKGGGKDEFKYITIPISYALKPFKVAFDGVTDLIDGTKGVNTKNVLESTTASIIDGYNPLGGTSLGSALIPTIADIPAEIGLNQKWTGSKIHPDSNPDLPESRQYFDSLKDTTLGRFTIALTKKLSDNHIAEISPANMAYAIQQYSGGAGNFISKTTNGISDAIGDEKVKLDELPFVSRFYKKIEGEELESTQSKQSKDASLIKEIRAEGSKENFDISQEVKGYVADIKKLPSKEEKMKYLKEIAKKDPKVIDKILNQFETDSKDFNQKQYESLQIANGERAKYVVTKLKAFKTKEEKLGFLKDLTKRKILTEDVIDQIPELLKK